MELSLTVQAALALTVVFLAGLVRGITGFGGAMVMAPSLSLVIHPVTAVVIALALESAAAVTMLPQALRRVRWGVILPIGLMAVLTIPVGGWLLSTIDREIARRFIAGMVVVFAGLMALGWRYPGPTRLPVSLALGGLSGVLIGATSMGGPPVILYLLAGPDPIDQTRANLIVFITLLSAVGLAILASLGVASWTDGAWCAALAPIYLGATMVGARLYGFFDERAFRRFTLIFMMVLSSALLFM